MRQLLKCCSAPHYRYIFCLLIFIVIHFETARYNLLRLARASKDAAALGVGKGVLAAATNPPTAYTDRSHVRAVRNSSYPSYVAKFRVAYTCELPVYKRQPAGMSLSDAVTIGIGNTGNFIWDYGAQHLLDPVLSELVEGFNKTTDLGRVHVHLLPTTNILFPGNMYSKVSDIYRGYKQCIELFNASVLMVGVGIQQEFPGGCILGSKHAALPAFHPSEYQLSSRQADFFEGIAKSGGLMTVRGKLTEAVFLANGLPPPEVLGCPSLLINKNPTLGATLLKKWNMVLRHGNPKDLRIAVGLPKSKSYWMAGT